MNCRNIPSDKILALTYTKSAAQEMKNRYTREYGSNEGIQFRTINSFADEVVRASGDYRRVIDNSMRAQIIRDLYKTHISGEWQATMDKIINALNYFGIDHSEEIIYTNGRTDVTLPKCCVILEKMGRYSHYLVYFDGVGYDSNLGKIEHYDVTKMKGYMEVYV